MKPTIGIMFQRMPEIFGWEARIPIQESIDSIVRLKQAAF
jgi:hypothetical protein